MFFFLSKTFNYLTMPLVIVCLLLLASALLRAAKWKKRCFVMGLALLLFWSNEFLANEAMLIWEVPPIAFKEVKKTYDYGIVLTGVAKAEMEPNDRVYFARGADRVTHTVHLYKLGLIKKIVLSGGSGRLIDIGEREADNLASAMIMMGVVEEDIIIENQSRNTHESAVNVKKLLESKTRPEDCLLITSGFHMRRSLGCFEREGWDVDSFSTDFLTHKRTFTFDVLFVPKIEALATWHHFIKETVGYLSYSLVGYI